MRLWIFTGDREAISTKFHLLNLNKKCYNPNKKYEQKIYILIETLTASKTFTWVTGYYFKKKFALFLFVCLFVCFVMFLIPLLIPAKFMLIHPKCGRPKTKCFRSRFELLLPDKFSLFQFLSTISRFSFHGC